MNADICDTHAAVDAIAARNQAWLDAAACRDLDGMMAHYADDARELLPDMQPLVGRAAIRTFYGALIEQLPRFSHSFAPDDVTVSASGDLAVACGSYTFTPDTDVPNRVDEGKYVGVWRYRQGVWRLFINISNGDPA